MKQLPTVGVLCGIAVVVVSYMAGIDSQSLSVSIVSMVAVVAWMTDRDLMWMFVACVAASCVAEWSKEKDGVVVLGVGVLVVCGVGVWFEGGVKAIPLFSWVHLGAVVVAIIGLDRVVILSMIITLVIAVLEVATGREMRILTIGIALGIAIGGYAFEFKFNLTSVVTSLAVLVVGYLVSCIQTKVHIARIFGPNLSEKISTKIALIAPRFNCVWLRAALNWKWIVREIQKVEIELQHAKEEDLFLHDKKVRNTEKIIASVNTGEIDETVELVKRLDLEPQLSTQPIVVSDKPSEVSMSIYLGIVDFEGISKQVTKIYPDVVCIIDISGSMSVMEKLNHVKITLISLLKYMEGGRLAIVTFSCRAEVLMPFTEVTYYSRDIIKKTVESMTIKGQTNIADAIKTSQQLLKSLNLKKNSIVSMLLLSDGGHNVGPLNLDDLFINDLLRTGTKYTLHTFGYGNDHDARLMHSISDRKNGNYYYVSDVAKVRKYFAECLKTIITTVAVSARLTLRLTPSADLPVLKIKKLYGPHWRRVSDTEAVMEIGNISEGFSKEFCLEVYVDSKDSLLKEAARLELATFTLEYTDTTGKTNSVSRKLTTLLYPKGSSVRVFTNEAAKRELLRARGADLIKKALDQHTQKRTGDAIETLRSFKAEINLSVVSQKGKLLGQMLKEFDIMVSMLYNEMHNRPNIDNTVSYMTQQINIYANQISAPQFGESQG